MKVFRVIGYRLPGYRTTAPIGFWPCFIKSCGRWGCFLELFSESKFLQPFQRYWHHQFFANFFWCQFCVGELSAAVSQKPFTNKIYCKRQKLFFSLGQSFGEKKFQNFLPLGGGWVVGRHSSPPIFFHKKLRKVGLFLRTFFRIKIYAAVPEI